jgi:hypothetical protein
MRITSLASATLFLLAARLPRQALTGQELEP